jgi:cyclase
MTTHAVARRFAPPRRATEVAEGVFAYVQPDGSWWINNTGFLVATDGVVSIDSCSTTDRTRAYLDAIARETRRPIRTLVNTHHHGDHTFGNYLFSGATIVGHDNMRAAMRKWGTPRSTPYWTDVDWGPVELAPPTLTFEDRVTLHLHDTACEVMYVGTPAHTNNDSVVWIPDRGVLFTGDLLFNGGTPFMLQGSIAGTLDALGRIAALGAETIVPGHGPVCGSEVIDVVSSYLRFVQGVAAAGRAAGVTPLEAARSVDLGAYADLLDAERIVGNLHRAYAEDAGAEPGAAIDERAALADMVAYNGGRPLTCYA